MRSFEERRAFKELLLADADIMRVLSRDDVGRACDLRGQLRHVDEIFARVFGGQLHEAGGWRLEAGVGRGPEPGARSLEPRSVPE
jgi:hypothetical protein